MVAILVAERYQRVDVMRQEALAVARLRGREPSEVVERGIRLDLACALGITEHSAGMLIAQADALVHRYPTVLDSLGGARMTQPHALALIEALDAVEPEFRDPLITPAVQLAEHQPVGTFRRRLRALVETVRAVTLSERHERAMQSRRTWVELAADGMAYHHWFGPAVEIRAAHDRITRQARILAKAAEQTRTLDQIRSDIVGDLLVDGDTGALPPEARGIRATVFVTVPVLALLDGDTARHGVASVEGVGPIPIEVARELCGGAKSWMRVLTHPEKGIVLSMGRKSTGRRRI